MKTNSYMRITTLFVSLLFVCFILWSFTNTSTSEGTKKYCEVVYDYRIDDSEGLSFQNEYKPSIWGNFSNYQNGNIENNKLKTYKNAIDALNYMGANGWKLIHHYHLTFNNGYITQDVYLMEK
ncbi:hypothetical protein [Confluentibacter lentus]|uniref:hypothetical protein n=1 Tax=Confluentibacter lentus TaxID=1699412 RepID=UPI000C28FC4B|nr:hypothetical protein [Confluentibacter lentus]